MIATDLEFGWFRRTRDAKKLPRCFQTNNVCHVYRRTGAEDLLRCKIQLKRTSVVSSGLLISGMSRAVPWKLDPSTILLSSWNIFTSPHKYNTPLISCLALHHGKHLLTGMPRTLFCTVPMPVLPTFAIFSGGARLTCPDRVHGTPPIGQDRRRLQIPATPPPTSATSLTILESCDSSRARLG